MPPQQLPADKIRVGYGGVFKDMVPPLSLATLCAEFGLPPSALLQLYEESGEGIELDSARGGTAVSLVVRRGTRRGDAGKGARGGVVPTSPLAVGTDTTTATNARDSARVASMDMRRAFEAMGNRAGGMGGAIANSPSGTGSGANISSTSGASGGGSGVGGPLMSEWLLADQQLRFSALSGRRHTPASMVGSQDLDAALAFLAANRKAVFRRSSADVEGLTTEQQLTRKLSQKFGTATTVSALKQREAVLKEKKHDVSVDAIADAVFANAAELPDAFSDSTVAAGMAPSALPAAQPGVAAEYHAPVSLRCTRSKAGHFGFTVRSLNVRVPVGVPLSSLAAREVMLELSDDVTADHTSLQTFVNTAEPGGPTSKAGLHSGDLLLEVNGLSVDGLAAAAVVEMINASLDTLVLRVRPLHRKRLVRDLVSEAVTADGARLRAEACRLAGLFGGGPRPGAAPDGEVVPHTRVGMLWRKMTLDAGGKRGKKRSWRRYYSVLNHAELAFYHAPGDQAAEGGRFDISGARCITAVDYVKRPSVCRVTFLTGVECLLQCQSPEDLQAWVAALNGKSPVMNALGAAEATPQQSGTAAVDEKLAAKSGGSLRRRVSNSSILRMLRRPSLEAKTLPLLRPSFFDLTMTEICDKFSTRISPVLRVCVDEIERRGLGREGIYRLAGSHSAMQSLKGALADDVLGVHLADEAVWPDLHVICGVVKQYIRETKEPLLTAHAYSRFISVHGIPDYDNRLYYLKGLVHQLPRCHFETLDFFVSHLHRVSLAASENKMAVRNLAIVFGPTLVRAGVDCVVSMINDMSAQCIVAEILIAQHAWIFSSYGDDVAAATDNADGAPARRLLSADTSDDDDDAVTATDSVDVALARRLLSVDTSDDDVSTTAIASARPSLASSRRVTPVYPLPVISPHANSGHELVTGEHVVVVTDSSTVAAIELSAPITTAAGDSPTGDAVARAVVRAATEAASSSVVEDAGAHLVVANHDLPSPLLPVKTIPLAANVPLLRFTDIGLDHVGDSTTDNVATIETSVADGKRNIIDVLEGDENESNDDTHESVCRLRGVSDLDSPAPVLISIPSLSPADGKSSDAPAMEQLTHTTFVDTLEESRVRALALLAEFNDFESNEPAGNPSGNSLSAAAPTSALAQPSTVEGAKTPSPPHTARHSRSLSRTASLYSDDSAILAWETGLKVVSPRTSIDAPIVISSEPAVAHLTASALQRTAVPARSISVQPSSSSSPSSTMLLSAPSVSQAADKLEPASPPVGRRSKLTAIPVAATSALRNSIKRESLHQRSKSSGGETSAEAPATEPVAALPFASPGSSLFGSAAGTFFGPTFALPKTLTAGHKRQGSDSSQEALIATESSRGGGASLGRGATRPSPTKARLVRLPLSSPSSPQVATKAPASAAPSSSSASSMGQQRPAPTASPGTQRRQAPATSPLILRRPVAAAQAPAAGAKSTLRATVSTSRPTTPLLSVAVASSHSGRGPTFAPAAVRVAAPVAPPPAAVLRATPTAVLGAKGVSGPPSPYSLGAVRTHAAAASGARGATSRAQTQAQVQAAHAFAQARVSELSTARRPGTTVSPSTTRPVATSSIAPQRVPAHAGATRSLSSSKLVAAISSPVGSMPGPESSC